MKTQLLTPTLSREGRGGHEERKKNAPTPDPFPRRERVKPMLVDRLLQDVFPSVRRLRARSYLGFKCSSIRNAKSKKTQREAGKSLGSRGPGQPETEVFSSQSPECWRLGFRFIRHPVTVTTRITYLKLFLLSRKKLLEELGKISQKIPLKCPP